jgi:hypothetical protein
LGPARALLLFLALIVPGVASAQTVQTIVFLRHGEKPAAGLGQLDCQGLNRALALPRVIAALGKVDAIFAPDPSRPTDDDGQSYNYVRPLATIEPTAIALGLPLDASIGFEDTGRLRTALEQPKYRKALIVVAWEHKEIENIVRVLLGAYGGDPAKVPKWKGDDFDSLYVVTLTRNGDTTTASFDLKHEGLDGQSTTCPR